jgi:MoaA/NifB/PqqE/SkfB family radical SAM enzyme
MYSFSDIRQVHLEITERCNAACPQCPRRIDGGAMNPKVTGAELSLGEIRRIMPVEFVRQLSKVYLCGNYGDPAAGADTLEIVRYLRDASPRLRIGIHSNGSLRNEDWWRDLARAIGENGYARFAIDGLEDTNHIYRRNTDWVKIVQNATAYIAAGGRAEWDFIVFAHNEHQVEAARDFSHALGFAAFNVKKTARFLKRDAMAYAAKSPVKSVSGSLVDEIQSPSRAEFRNDFLESLEADRARHSSFDAYLDSREIDCKAVREKSIYISAAGQVLPCCYLAAMLKNPPGDETRQFSQLFDGVAAELSATGNVSVEKIVAGHFFQNQVKDKWQSGGEKLKVCARVCGR